jgi:hypothetical protein
MYSLTLTFFLKCSSDASDAHYLLVETYVIHQHIVFQNLICTIISQMHTANEQ